MAQREAVAHMDPIYSCIHCVLYLKSRGSNISKNIRRQISKNVRRQEEKTQQALPQANVLDVEVLSQEPHTS